MSKGNAFFRLKSTVSLLLAITATMPLAPPPLPFFPLLKIESSDVVGAKNDNYKKKKKKKFAIQINYN